MGKAGRKREYKKPRVFTTKFEQDIIDAYEAVMHREGRHVNDGLAEHMKEYVEIHGAGNPAYTIENFVENEEFKITPAFFEKWPVWERFLEGCTDKELGEIINRADQLICLAEKVKKEKAIRAKNAAEDRLVANMAKRRDSVDDIFDQAAKEGPKHG